MKNSQQKTQWFWFDLSMSSKITVLWDKLKGHYMTYYMCFIQTLIIPCPVYEIQPVKSSCDLYLTVKGHLIWSMFLMQTERLYMTLKMCFIETLVLACTVSEILAQIDHQGPNWTFLTFRMNLGVILRLSYFKIVISFTRKKLNDAIHLVSTSLLLININNYRTMGSNLTFPCPGWLWDSSGWRFLTYPRSARAIS